MRAKRNSTGSIRSLHFDKQAEVNLKFISESTSALLGVTLTPSVLMRRALELLADRWMNEAVDTLAGKSTAETKMEKLTGFLQEERRSYSGRPAGSVRQSLQLWPCKGRSTDGCSNHEAAEGAGPGLLR